MIVKASKKVSGRLSLEILTFSIISKRRESEISMPFKFILSLQL